MCVHRTCVNNLLNVWCCGHGDSHWGRTLTKRNRSVRMMRWSDVITNSWERFNFSGSVAPAVATTSTKQATMAATTTRGLAMETVLLLLSSSLSGGRKAPFVRFERDGCGCGEGVCVGVSGRKVSCGSRAEIQKFSCWTTFLHFHSAFSCFSHSSASWFVGALPPCLLFALRGYLSQHVDRAYYIIHITTLVYKYYCVLEPEPSQTITRS